MTKKTTSDQSADLAQTVNILAYFAAYPGRTMMAAGKDLGLKPQEIKANIDRLFQYCGRPGMYPDDRVDIGHLEGKSPYKKVEIINAQGLDRPLRLTATEAAVLLLILESLDNYPGLADPTVIRSAAQKIRKIAQNAAIAITEVIPEENAVASAQLALVHKAFRQNRQLTFRYASASSDHSSQREVSITLLTVPYIISWEEAVGEHRTFLLDRMSELVVTEKVAHPHTKELEQRLSDPISFSSSTPVAMVQLRRSATWLANYHPLKLHEVGEEWVIASFPYGKEDWLVRFALSNADRLRILEPVSAAAEVARRAKAYEVCNPGE